MMDMSSGLMPIERNRYLFMELGDCPNVEFPTQGGKRLWSDLSKKAGWRLQHNYLTGFSRILDENNIRKAWGSPCVMKEKFKRLTRNDFFEPGDVVGVVRKKALNMYEHYAVYIGDGQVIHYAGNGEDFKGRVCVKVDTIKNFLKDDDNYFVLYFDRAYAVPRKIQVRTTFNMNDLNMDNMLVFPKGKKMTIYSPEETVKRAESRLGEDKYNLVMNNCEHFAIWCKTGISESYQVKRAFKAFIKLPFGENRGGL